MLAAIDYGLMTTVRSNVRLSEAPNFKIENYARLSTAALAHDSTKPYFIDWKAFSRITTQY